MFKDLSSQIRTIYHKVKLGYSLVNQIGTDNSKVTGYLPPAAYNLPPAVYDQLMAFKAKRGLQSVEMAVTVILSEYFGLSQAPVVTETDTTSRLETLEANCTSLSETVAELRAAIATLQTSSTPLGESEPSADQSEPLPLLDAHANAQFASNPALEQSESPRSPRPQTLKEALVTAQPESSLSVNQSERPSPTAASALHSGSTDELTETGSLLIRSESELPYGSDSSAAPTTLEHESASAASGELAIPEPVNQPFSTPMTQAVLAKRLGVNTSSISRMQSKPNFSEWSQQKDPEGIAWVKSPDTKLFYPQTQIEPE